MSYPLEKLHQEVAFISYYFHWSLDSILELSHAQRHVWMRELSRIHQEMK